MRLSCDCNHLNNQFHSNVTLWQISKKETKLFQSINKISSKFYLNNNFITKFKERIISIHIIIFQWKISSDFFLPEYLQNIFTKNLQQKKKLPQSIYISFLPEYLQNIITKSLQKEKKLPRWI